MRNSSKISYIFAAFALVVSSLAIWGEVAEAAQPIGISASATISCPAFDGISVITDASAEVKCGRGFRSILMETEETNSSYICGATGATLATRATTCLERCVGCANGSSFSADITQAGPTTVNLRCISNVSATPTVWKIFCGR